MIALAAILALAVAADPSASPRRTALDASNAARARAGLLPRKPARARAEVRGHRIVTVSAPAPTYLAEPVPLAGTPRDPPVIARAPVDDAAAAARGAVPEEIGPLRFAARGVATEVTLILSFDP